VSITDTWSYKDYTEREITASAVLFYNNMSRLLKPTFCTEYLPTVNIQRVREYIRCGLRSKCPYGVDDLPRIIGVQGSLVVFQFRLHVTKADALTTVEYANIDTQVVKSSQPLVSPYPAVQRKPMVSDIHAAYIDSKVTHCVLECVAMVPISAMHNEPVKLSKPADGGTNVVETITSPLQLSPMTSVTSATANDRGNNDTTEQDNTQHCSSPIFPTDKLIQYLPSSVLETYIRSVKFDYWADRRNMTMTYMMRA